MRLWRRARCGHCTKLTLRRSAGNDFAAKAHGRVKPDLPVFVVRGQAGDGAVPSDAVAEAEDARAGLRREGALVCIGQPWSKAPDSVVGIIAVVSLRPGHRSIGHHLLSPPFRANVAPCHPRPPGWEQCATAETSATVCIHPLWSTLSCALLVPARLVQRGSQSVAALAAAAEESLDHSPNFFSGLVFLGWRGTITPMYVNNG